MAMRVSICLLFLLGGTIVFTGQATPFIGAEKCGSCHPDTYAQWRVSVHGKAEQRLPLAQRRDPRCTSCHSPQARDGFSGVQCESCHGAGANYWPAAVMKDKQLAEAAGLRKGNEEFMCRQCHRDENTKGIPFHFSSALEKILHRPKSKEKTRP